MLVTSTISPGLRLMELRTQLIAAVALTTGTMSLASPPIIFATTRFAACSFWLLHINLTQSLQTKSHRHLLHEKYSEDCRKSNTIPKWDRLDGAREQNHIQQITSYERKMGHWSLQAWCPIHWALTVQLSSLLLTKLLVAHPFCALVSMAALKTDM